MNLYKKALKSLRTRYFFTGLLENVLYLIIILSILFIGANFLINTFQNNFTILKSITIIFKLLSLIVILFYIFKSASNIHSLAYFAEKVSEKIPESEEIFLSSYELEKSRFNNKTQYYSDEIINANIKLANEFSQKLKTKNIIDFAILLKPVKFLFLIILMFMVNFLFQKSSFSTSFFALTKIENFAPKYDENIYVFPGNITLLKGKNQKIKIKNFYPKLQYSLNYEINRRWKSINLQKDNYLFFNVCDEMRYFVQNKFANSDTFKINVLEKPTINNLDISYDYPSYSKLSNKIEENVSGNIIALNGTKITLFIDVNNELNDYRIVFSDEHIMKLKKINKFKYSTKFTINKSFSYHFFLKDILQNLNHPIERTVYAERDFSPKIGIISPAKDKILAQNMTEDIEYFASDDFGISKLLINFKKNDEEYQSKIVQKNINSTNFKSTYQFDLNNQNLLPGDVICYHLEIFDNCNFPAKQSSKSNVYLLKFPSIEELYEEIQKEQEDKFQTLSEKLNETQKNREKFEELRRKFLKKEEMNWEEKEDLKSVLQKQNKLAKKAEESAQEYKNFIEQIEKNRVVSNETLEKLQQIQEIMEEISTTELQEAMKKLQDAMKDITPEEMKKSLENFKFSQEEFLKKLEETLKLLRSIQLEQDMQKCLQQAEELEKLQNDLNQQTNEQIDEEKRLDELSDEQKNISEKYDNLQKNIQDLIKKLSENSKQKPAQELQNGLSKMEESELSENMQNAENKMKKNDSENLPSMQNCISQSFSQLKQSIQSAQSMMQSAMQKKMQELIEKTIFDLLYFSQKQEEFLDEKYTAYDILDEEIAMYDGLKNSINNLFSIPQIMLLLSPKFSFHTAETFNEFEKMFEKIKNRRNYRINKNKQQIYVSLNRMIIDLLQSQQSSGQGGGGMQSLLEQLQQMSQGQGSINMFTQALFEQMMQQQMQGLSPEQRNMIGRIAADEKQIKENMERILRDFPETEKLLGNLGDLEKELKEVLKKLDKGIIDKELIEQQERIFSRLLDAQKSVHRRDFSKKRESKSPQKQIFQTPDSLIVKEEKIQIKDILKFINENYPEEYHRLIKKYLEKIQNEK